ADTGATVRFRDARTITAAPSAPDAPTDLTAVATADRITLDWTDNANDEVGYRIERRTGGGAFTTLATLGVDAATYADTTAVPGTTYDYRVVAFNSGGEAVSTSASATITPTATVPAAPTGLTATAVEAGVSLEWFDNADDETGYRIERRAAGGTFTTVGNAAANATSFLDDAAQPGTTYDYRVVAVNTAGDSPASNTASATTDPEDNSGDQPTVLYEQKFDGNSTLDYRTYTGGVQTGGTFTDVGGVFVVSNTGGFGSWYTTKLPIPDSGQVRFSVDVSTTPDVEGALNIGYRLDGGSYILLERITGQVDGVVTVTADSIDASLIQLEIQGRAVSGSFRFDNISLTDNAPADNGGGGDTGGGDTGVGDNGNGDTGGGNTDTGTVILAEDFDGNGNLPYNTYSSAVQPGGFFGIRNGKFVAENTGAFTSWYTPKLTLPAGGPYTFSIDVESTNDVAGLLNVGVRVAGGSYQLLQSFRNPITGTVTVSLDDIPPGLFQIEIQAKTTTGSFSFDNVRITQPADDNGGGGDTGGNDNGNTGSDNNNGDTGSGDTGSGNADTGTDLFAERFDGNGNLPYSTYSSAVQPGGFYGIRDGKFVAENTGNFTSWYTPKLTLPAGGPYTFALDVSSSANVVGQFNVNVRIAGEAQVVQSFRNPITGTLTVRLADIPPGQFQIELQARTTSGSYAFDNIRIYTPDDGSSGNNGNNNGGNDDNTQTVTGLNWSNAPQPAASYAESGRAVVGDDVFLFGGYRVDFSSTTDVFRFRDDQWTTMAAMPEAITHAGIETVDDQVWFAGGYRGINDTPQQTYGTRTVWIYDTPTDTWSRGPDLPAERAGGDLVLIGRNLHFLGGQNTARTVDTRDHWVLNLDNQSAGWQARADMPVGRNHLAAEAHDGQLYFFGSQTGTDENLTAHADVYAYNPATNQWTQKASMPAPRNHMHQTLVKKDGKLYVFAGQADHNDPQDDIYEYTFATDTWRTIGTTPEARTSPTVSLLPDGRVLMVGGFRPGFIYPFTYYGEFTFG
ncbi:MAG: kelch repeat-containing protein, partial [Planctomycetota bacterium]